MITDASCGGKAAFIISGNDVTVRNLGFARIRVPDDNGAGIRGEGRDLTVEDSRFVNTQMGILATSPSGGVLRILGCRFSEVGSSLIGRINFAVRASGFDVVRIEHSVFDEASGGGHISVDGARTELVGNRLVDEGGHMAGPMVSLQGGALLLEGNTVEVAKGAAMRPGVVLATGNDVRALMVRDNIFRDALGGTPLVRNWTGQDGVATGNTVPAGTEVVSNAGVIYYRLRVVANDFRDSLRELWREARHLAGALLRRLG